MIAIGAPEGVHPAVRRTAPDLADVATTAAAMLADDVVLVTRDEESRKVARSARLVLGPEHVGLLHVTAPVTAWAVVLSGLASGDLPASSASAVSEAVLARTTTRVLLSSVASLDRPAPTLRQHLGSYLPRTAFVVDPDRGTVGRFSGRLGIPDGGDLLVVARSGRAVVRGAESELLPREPDVDLGVPATSWRAARWMEVSTLDGAVCDVAAGALSARPEVCDACGRDASVTCVFCQVADRRARPQAPGRTTPVGPVPAELEGAVR
ncbi:hypothetical protein UQW22_18635 [Isoptericola halotolerans]|uniref:hypothetical protein n=1 Tax=Isoptericola halotolerans TaxID=300560 RepID=UPI00388D3924